MVGADKNSKTYNIIHTLFFKNVVIISNCLKNNVQKFDDF